MLTVVVAAALYAVYREWDSIVDTLSRIGPGAAALSGLAGALGVLATYPVWREVLAGLGAAVPWRVGARVYFVTQLGKYIPGSAWPALMQMEATRSYARRRTTLSANLMALVVSCAVGLIVACVLLPLYNLDALRRYWWLLLALPVLLVLLHPRALPAVMDRLFGLLHRPPLDDRLEPAAQARAIGWSLLSWLALGLHLTVLCAALGHGGVPTFVLSTGGFALAMVAGVLLVPAPAGAGIREAVLTLVLAPILTAPEALAVAIASRAILIVVDLVLAGLAALVGARPRTGEAPTMP